MKLPEAVDAALSRIADEGSVADAEEGQRLDFKQQASTQKDSFREIADTAACLANTDGGWIVVGVADRGTGTDALLGTTLEAARVRKQVRDLTRPPLDVAVDEFEFRGSRLLLVEVRPGDDFVSDQKGRAPRRYGRDCVGMDPVQQRQLREQRSSADWSARPAKGHVLDERALAGVRAHLRASLRPERRGLASLNDDDLLRALGVTAPDGSLLRGGAVLLGAEGTSLVYQYKDSPGGEPRQIERLEGALIVIYDRVLELVSAHRRSTPLTLPNGQQLQIQDFPEIAVREALSNALLHRDYLRREPITVEHSPHALAVTSPGPLVSGVTVDNILTHPSKPRNPTLANSCRVVELAEEVGRGVDRMYREMVRAGGNIPEISDTGDHVRVALTGGAPDLNIARFVAEQPEVLRDDTDAMLILLWLCTRRTVSAAELTSYLQKGPDECQASLLHLSSNEIGLLEPTRETSRRARPSYRLRADVVRALGTAVPYARHTSDEIEQRMIAHVREYERITNATVKNLFNVGVQRANQILKQARDSGLIVRTSEATRGPSVEYGPGPNFPPKRSTRRRAPAAPNQEALSLDDASARRE